jgi:hypothetical protein
VNHGEALQDTGTDSGTQIHHNVFRDQIATNGDLVFVDPVTGTHSSFAFYDNVDFCSAGTMCHHNDGIIACINSSQTCMGFAVYNNTIANCSNNCGIVSTNAGSYTVQNNLWYNANPAPVGGYTEDYNTFLGSGTGNGSGSHDVTATSAANPFVGLAAGDLSLASEGSLWNNRLALPAPYDTDISGHAFTTDRGASQFRTRCTSPGLDVGVRSAHLRVHGRGVSATKAALPAAARARRCARGAARARWDRVGRGCGPSTWGRARCTDRGASRASHG